ncbi:Alsin [Desmophyllum pertusum]|uniref:Alsin n=1 Tax=Desmophyllum pertusum TaxID=174260 RepID=A0A9W9ZUN8_9CNID|nr:Alsin [Desmophyllum pertusum]
MGATCSKYCLCYCLKLCEFGDSFRCCRPCCIQYCEPCCHCGDCCDVEDNLPFMEESEASLREGEDATAFVYPNGDRYIGAWHDNKKHGYGELVRKDGTSLKGYFVEDQFVGETPSASTALTGASIEEDHSSKSIKQTQPTVSYRKLPPAMSTNDQEELLLDT